MVRRLLALALVALLAAGCIGEASSAESSGPVVFLGDSITQFQPWEATLPGLDLRNEGLNGNTTEQILGRLRDTIAFEPSKVFILTGSNDLWFEVPIEESRRHLDRMLSRLARRAPGATVYVESVLPREPEFDGHLFRLNAVLRQVAEEHGVTWIDLWPALVEGGRLRPGYDVDGVHLSGAGQQAWADVLRPYVEA